MINTLSKIYLSKIGLEGGRSTSIWIMSLDTLGFFGDYPLPDVNLVLNNSYQISLPDILPKLNTFVDILLKVCISAYVCM